ncbi:MAG TPA: NAD(P)/FAD-dependent oxidoreductase [Candidatus Nitrosotenuis sp.]|jgi:thioredoxin reductase (NADPH)|nr:NAD(P)/FAD-dependent oxidoreductase [Candidatus Nitrosotenuis sp.]
MSAPITDITFIGAGPAALFGIFCAGMRQATSRIIDSMDQIGGQLTALYPEKDIYDVGGIPRILAKDLVAQLVRQMQPFNPEIHLKETAQRLEANPDGTLTVITDKGRYPTRSVVLTVGIGSFVPRKLDLPALVPYEGKCVHYFVTDKEIFRDRRLLIVGGGDSAMDWVLNLKDIARHITLVHRSDRFRALDASVKEVYDLARTGKVEILTYHEVKDALFDDGNLRQLTLVQNKSGETRQVEADHLLLMLGFVANLGPIKDWTLTYQGQTSRLSFDGDLIEVDTTMRTGMYRVYAAGDVVSYPGKLKLIALAFGEVAIAVATALSDIRGKKMGTLHSSNLPPPSELGKKIPAAERSSAVR